MRYKTIGICMMLLAVPLLAEKFQMNPTPAVPAAIGRVNARYDSNGNTSLNIHVKHLAKPADLSPAKITYVVWTEAPHRAPQNIGELNVSVKLKADLKTATALHEFQLVVTAENNPRATAPSGPVVLSANVHQP